MQLMCAFWLRDGEGGKSKIQHSSSSHQVSLFFKKDFDINETDEKGYVKKVLHLKWMGYVIELTYIDKKR